MVLTQQLAVGGVLRRGGASLPCRSPLFSCSRAHLFIRLRLSLCNLLVISSGFVESFSTALVFIGSEQALLPPDQKPLGSCGHINQLWPRSVPLIGSAEGLQREGFPPQSMCLHAASPVPACVCKCQWNHGVCVCVCEWWGEQWWWSTFAVLI